MALPIIFAAISSAILGALLVVALLKYKEIINWFLGKRHLKEEDKARIAFTVKEELKNGNHKVVQGIFDTRTDKIVDGAQYEAKELDEDLAHHHRKNKLVVYQ